MTLPNASRCTALIVARSMLALATCGAPVFLALGAGLVLPSCSKPPPPPPPPQPPPPPPQPVPDPIQVDALLQSMKPDARVQFPQTAAPVDEAVARAAIQLADALARGNARQLAGMLSPQAKQDLDSLTASGEWDEATASIEAVRIVRITETPATELPSTSAVVYLAVQDPEGAYIVAFSGQPGGTGWVFTGYPCTRQVLKLASEWDGASESDLSAGAMRTAMPGAGMLPAGIPSNVGSMFGSSDDTLMMGFAVLDLARRIEFASGSTASPQQKQMLQALVAQMPAGSLDELRRQAQEKIAAGYRPPSQNLVMLVQAGEQFALQLGGKVTRDQVIQFVSNIFGMSEVEVRQALGENVVRPGPGQGPATPPGRPGSSPGGG